MGNCVALNISCDETLNYVCGCLCGDGNYIKKLSRNLDDLENSLEELVARRADLSRSVQLEERKGLIRSAEVQLWLSRAEAIETRACGLIKDRTKETGRLCMNGCCSKNFRSSYRYGEMVWKTLKDVREHKSQGVFNVLAEILTEPVNQRQIKPTVGLDILVDKAWNLLMKEDVGTLGIYGMGGVGKTTLLTMLNNKFAEDLKEFDIVIWITVSKDQRIAKIQEEIGKRLCIHNDKWAQEEEEQKASDVHKVLKGQRFVLLLDDVWGEIDLQKIGVPYPGPGNSCKIVYTARSKEARGCLSIDAEMDVACLEPGDAWDLFQKSVGEITLNSHEDIRKLAEDMAARCGGLPLALIVIGAAMSGKRTVQEWHDAVEYFISPRHRFPHMADGILSILKFSYDDLGDDIFQRCFQYCALFPEDYEIEKALIDYWFAENLLDRGNRTHSLNYGYTILGKLVRTCLLVDDESKGIVKMHDLVREMALKVACSEPYNVFNFIVKTGTYIRFVPELDESPQMHMDVRRISLMDNQIMKALCFNCPELLTLFLHNNDLLEMSSVFFYYMPKLVVLDLSRNYNLRELPTVSSLSSLRHLDVSHTEIGIVPGLKDLRMLVHLNLEFTTELRDIDGILFLRKLEVLKLLGSRYTFSDSLSRMRKLWNLQLLTTSINGNWEDINGNCNLARCIHELSIRMVNLSFITVQALHSLRFLEIRDSNISEIRTDTEKGEFLDLPVSSWGNSFPTGFSNLSRVEIINCDNLRHLTWLMCAPKLTHLRVVQSQLVEEIICKEKTSDEQKEEVPFMRLQLLHLQDLGELKGVHWSPLPFPYLTKIVIFGCPKLKKLPLNSESAKRQNLVIDADKEWLEGLEWEDEVTKQRFSLN